MKSLEFEITDEVLEKVNRFTRKQLTREKLYCFPVILCDNEIDRDNERFSVKSLERLAELFVGKTGIFDHDPKGHNQTARIFDAYVEKDEGRLTSCGDDYVCLVARAYMVRTDSNAPLIEEIDAGIKKEVSVSCAVGSKHCSVCGTNIYKSPCSHIKGKSYGGKRCFVTLDEPTDAYEWSFVAVPAQPAAGVSKTYGGDNEPDEAARTQRDEKIEQEHFEMRKALEARAIGLYALNGTEQGLARTIVASKTPAELIGLITKLSLKASRGGGSQLSSAKEDIDKYTLR